MGKKKSLLIVRRVVVNPYLAPQQVIFDLYPDDTDFMVLITMPDGGGRGKQKKVFFFMLNRHMSDEEIKEEYRYRKFVPADPFSLAQINRNEIHFCEKYKNFTHWKDKTGAWCFLACGPLVHHGQYNATVVNYSRKGWGAGWWAAGVRKS